MLGLNGLFNSLTGFGIETKDEQGETKLFRAARQGNAKQVKKLLRQGADPDTKNDQGLTPLHQAAYWGETEIVQLLLEAGAKPDADNGRGWTPLHSAAMSGGYKVRKDIIDLLIAAGADQDKPDKHGWTPEEYMLLWAANAEAAAKLQKFMEIENNYPPEVRQPDAPKNELAGDRKKAGKRPPAPSL